MLDYGHSTVKCSAEHPEIKYTIALFFKKPELHQNQQDVMSQNQVENKSSQVSGAVKWEGFVATASFDSWKQRRAS